MVGVLARLGVTASESGKRNVHVHINRDARFVSHGPGMTRATRYSIYFIGSRQGTVKI